MFSVIITLNIYSKARNMLPSGRYTQYNIINAASLYNITANQNQILSIRLENYFYPEHFANGLTTVSGITLNLASGRKYSFEDLFVPGNNYEEVLNKIIEQQIEEEDIPLFEQYPGITGQEEFYLTLDKLVIIYQEYDLTPGYYGVLEFDIPYNEIESVINPEGPIAKLIE